MLLAGTSEKWSLVHNIRKKDVRTGLVVLLAGTFEKWSLVDNSKKKDVRTGLVVCAGEGINTDAGNEQEALFSLSALRGKGNLVELAEVSAPAEHEMEELEADSDTNAAQPHELGSSDDSDDEDR